MIIRPDIPISQRSLACIEHRFGNFRNAAAHSTFHLDSREFFAQAKDWPPGTMSCVVSHRDQLSGALFQKGHARITEVMEYEDGAIAAVLTKMPGALARFELASRPWGEPIASVQVAAFFTDTDPYRSFVEPFVEHYLGVDFGVPVTVHLHWFGDQPLPFFGPRVSITHSSLQDFNEWRANAPLTSCGSELVAAAMGGPSHVLKVDGDTLVPPDAFRKLRYVYETHPSHGVLNLKEDIETGPGLLFASSVQLARNTWHADWPAPFYHCDTEFLMNFSRLRPTIVPLVAFVGIDRRDHARPHSEIQQANWPTLAEIMLLGRPQACDHAALQLAARAIGEVRPPDGQVWVETCERCNEVVEIDPATRLILGRWG